MNEYYGITTPTDDFIAHYGIKGMKWGVRKAIQSGNDRRLAKNWEKAQKKLEKLNKKADVGEQKKQQMKYVKRDAIGLGVAGLGLGSPLIANRLLKKAEANRAIMSPNWSGSQASYDAQLAKHNAEFSSKRNTARKISAAIGLAGLGYAGYSGARSMAAYRRTTPKGHKKAVENRNAWQREINKTFAGTKYIKKKKRR